MKNLEFKYAAAYNFLPFGPEGIEINFQNYGNVILIRGQNKDITTSCNQEDFRSLSNGSGKSSIPDILSFGCFGKTIKRKLTPDKVVHNLVGQDCRVEVVIGSYRIVRTRLEKGKDKSSLRLWKSDEGIWDKNTEITPGKATQKQIDKILGISYETFVNMCVFTDDLRMCFLESDAEQKREIIENLLSLHVYRSRHEKAKFLRKQLKQNIDVKGKEYQIFLENERTAKKRIQLTQEKHDNWLEKVKNDIKNLEWSLKTQKVNLQQSDTGKKILEFQQAQEEIETLRKSLQNCQDLNTNYLKSIPAIDMKKSEIDDEYQKINNEHNEKIQLLNIHISKYNDFQEQIKRLQRKENGAICSECCEEISEHKINDHIKKLQIDCEAMKKTIDNVKTQKDEIQKRLDENQTRKQKVKDFRKQLDAKISKNNLETNEISQNIAKLSQIKEPKLDDSQVLAQNKLESTQKEIENKKNELNGQSPFADILLNDQEELSKSTKLVKEKEEEIKLLESEIPYYDYWIAGFGDHGIRKWIIEGILPHLNNRINYWLQYVVDNKFTLNFDSQLDEIIERNPPAGKPYIYHSMSSSQRRSLNLAVSQAFADITSISTGFSPSIVFLDEITTNMASWFVAGIYKMICELSENKKVFVTTHDHDLLKMLDGCTTINLIHENGFTKLQN